MGHFVVPIVPAVETDGSLPQWASLTIWPLFAVVLALGDLPRAKALLMTIIGFTHAPASEHEPSPV